MLKFTVDFEKGKYVVEDQRGVRYGTYDTKSEADASAQGWAQYYGGETKEEKETYDTDR